jgi:hypothetical protein
VNENKIFGKTTLSPMGAFSKFFILRESEETKSAASQVRIQSVDKE